MPTQPTPKYPLRIVHELADADEAATWLRLARAAGHDDVATWATATIRAVVRQVDGRQR